ncbi:MAG: acetamidase/formamidase family protein [Anaerolineae bacterium]|nr:acetamidase/formamidase family protein [Anaerolineae bacterium]
MALHRLEPQVYHYTFAAHPPALRIEPGDRVVAETRDAFGLDRHRQPLPEAMKPDAPGTSLRESNPVVGPVYVQGAKEGDLLAVRVLRIDITRDVAISKQNTNFGSLTGEGPGHMLLYNEPIPTIWYEWQLDLERGVGVLELPDSRLRRVEIPLRPFIGSIGVAPRYGRVEMTLTPGEYGGNMDYPEVGAGSTLYLPVWVDGAYLSFGDVHAAQGDGEVNGTALEVPAEVMLEIGLCKGQASDWPRLETDTHIMTLGSTRPLMDCVRLAQIELLNWLVHSYGFRREEAWQLSGQVGSMRIGNVVDPCYTVAARFPKAYLPPG